jgi:hypothetical protein
MKNLLRRQWLLPLMLALALALAFGIYLLLREMPGEQSSPPQADSSQPPVNESTSTAAQGAAVAASSVGTDSTTAAALEPARPLEPEIQQALEQMTDTRSEGLVEEPAVSGYSVNLQGRFQAVPVATVNERGEVEIQEYSVPEAEGSADVSR